MPAARPQLSTRPPIQRLAVLDAEVRAGRYPNAVTLAARLEVDPRTVQRDVEFARDRLGAPLAFCRRKNGYFYEDPTYRMPAVDVTEGELLALFVSAKALGPYRGTPFGEDVARAAGKLSARLTGEVPADPADVAAALSVAPMAVPEQDLSVFRTLLRAARRHTRLRLTYWSASSGETADRTVDPYHLAAVGEDWYLIGYCHTRQAVRMFSAVRVRAAEPATGDYEVPADFDPAAYLGGSFRAVRGEPDAEYRVELRFTPAFAGRLAEKRWHPSQGHKFGADGALRLRLTVSDLTEVTRWVLSWGVECEVLGPAELRDRVAEEAAGLVRMYAGGPS